MKRVFSFDFVCGDTSMPVNSAEEGEGLKQSLPGAVKKNQSSKD